jgi:NADH-quinone oxidoreductase subunit G
LANRIGAATGATVGFLTEAANTVGGYIANATPGEGGKNARAMTQTALQAYVLLHTEPEFDCADGAAALAAMQAAGFVVALSPFKHAALDYADVLLPISPFSETSGTFVNAEGRAQSFNGVVRPLGETRPAWKVLRVLGNLLKVEACEFDSSEAVRAQVLGTGIADKLNNSVKTINKYTVVVSPYNNSATERIAYIPLYSSDALVRRAPALQQTADAKAPTAVLGSSLWQQLGLGGSQSNANVTLKNGAAQITIAAERDDRLPANAVRLAAGHHATFTLGAMNATLTVEKA